MKKNIKYFLLLIFCFQFIGCIGYNTKIKSYSFNKSSYRKLESPKKGWNKIAIYDELDPSDKYDKVAKIVITGNASTSEFSLLKKMRKEAGRYSADAILHTETREISRASVNGVAVSLNLLSIFMLPSESDPLDLEMEMGGDYIAIEVEGLAIKFIED
jgi:hypothetical protein